MTRIVNFLYRDPPEKWDALGEALIRVIRKTCEEHGATDIEAAGIAARLFATGLRHMVADDKLSQQEANNLLTSIGHHWTSGNWEDIPEKKTESEDAA